MSAARETNSFTISGWFSRTAHIKAVCPRTFSLALTSAPRSKQQFDGIDFAGSGCGHQRSLATGIRGVRVGSGFQQGIDHRGVPLTQAR